MENLAELLFGETEVSLLGDSSTHRNTSDSNESLSFSFNGVPNSFLDPVLPPPSSNSMSSLSFSPIIAPPHFSNASPKLRAMKSATMEKLVELLYDSESRQDAIACLIEKFKCTHEACSKGCEALAILLWNGFGITNVLLQELLFVYPMLSPVKVTTEESKRVCNVLKLFQVMAAHPEIKMGLVRAEIPPYIYPILSAAGDDIPIRHMKISSLEVIGSLVKCEEPLAQVVVHFLLQTDLYPLCLSCMDSGNSLESEVSKVATYILLKMLMQDEGLKYCCKCDNRFFSTICALGDVVNEVAIKQDERWLCYVIHCYIRLSESQSTIVALKHHFPPKLRDDTFNSIFQQNADIRRLIRQLFCNMAIGFSKMPMIPKPREVEIEEPNPKQTAL